MFRAFMCPRRVRICSLLPLLLCTPAAWGQFHLPTPRISFEGSRLAIPMDTRSQHAMVDVRINGKGPFRCALDTGAGRTMLGKKLVESLDLPVLGMAQANDATANKPVQVKLLTIDRIEFGGAKITHIVGFEHDLTELTSNEPGAPEGVLGIDLFNGCLLQLDYPGNQVVLMKGDLPKENGKDILTYRSKHGLIEVPLMLAGIETPFVIDSGATGCLGLPDDEEGKYPLQSAPAPTRITKRAFSQTIAKQARIAGDLEFGAFRFREPTAGFHGTHRLIGYEVLKHGALTVDQENLRLQFTPSASEPPRARSIHMSGMGTRWTDGARQIDAIIPGGPAEQAGLKVGDRIMAADGKPVSQITYYDWREMFSEAGSYTLSVERDGVRREYPLKTACAVE